MSVKDDEKIIPERDEIASYQHQSRRRASSKPGAKRAHSTKVSRSSSTLFKFAVVIVAAILLGLAAWLHQDLTEAKRLLGHYGHRIKELEDRLSLTDEDVSESMQNMRANVRELDSEIRKLWDNVWKKSKEHLALHDKQLQQQAASISAMKQQQSKNNAQMTQLVATSASDTQRLASMDTALKTLNDRLSRLSDDVVEIEGWVDSINGFRRQTNSELVLLKQQVDELEN